MVSGTRCLVQSNQLKNWSESRAAAPKSQHPVGHGVDFLTSVCLERSDLRLKRATLRSILGLF